MSHHPIDDGRENPAEVFKALVETLPELDRQHWTDRFAAARDVQRRRDAHDRDWDRSLMGIARFGQ